MSPAGTFERVYAAIKDQLRKGAFRPGERLEPAALGDQLNSSVTPIRDALHRLTGERLVETPRHEGFRTPLLTETMLRHLYAWHLDLLLIATAKKRSANRGGAEANANAAAGEPSPAERRNAMFLDLVASTGNSEHLAALQTLIDRMGPCHRLEDELLDAVESETEDICEAVRSADRRGLRRSLIAYHRRRARIVPELLDRMQSR